MNQDLESDSVCLGHHDRTTREEAAQKQQAFLSHSSVVWEVQWTRCWVRPVPRWPSFLCNLRWQKGQGRLSWFSSMKALIPIITQRPDLKGPSHRVFIFQHTNLGAAQAFNPQQMSHSKLLISFFYIHLLDQLFIASYDITL